MGMVSSEDIRDMTRVVAETVLNMSIDPLPPREPLSAEQQSMFAWVRISGAWEGSVMIGCSGQLARRAAGAMFDVPPEDATESDLSDAIGELANVLGGNVKGLVPGPSLLSLPTVSADLGPGASGAGEARELWFECQGEPLVVIVHLPAA